MKIVWIFLFFFSLTHASQGQVYRSLDGQGNNLEHPDWGSANTPFALLLKPHFSDGFSLPAGQNRVSPRNLSLLSLWDVERKSDAFSLSNYAGAWAKFIYNDICSEWESEEEFIGLDLEESDPHFGLHALAGYTLKFPRTVPMEGTGTSPFNFRRYANTTTTWIDGSQIYGAEHSRAQWLRSFEHGKLRSSSDQQLPMNTLNGNFEEAPNPFAPFMLNPRQGPRKYYVSGSSKANENFQQLALHTLFLREHNRICDSLISNMPLATDEEIYQKARALVIALLQKITYEEWLPSMGIELPPYQGYDSNTDPSLLEYYAGAGAHITHSSMPSELVMVSEQRGLEHLPFLHSYFNPTLLSLRKNYEEILRGMAIQAQNPIDPYLPFALRNFFDPSFTAPIYDYWSANVIKGRDRGLPDYNSLRQSLGFSYVHSFYQVTRNTDLAFQLFAHFLDMSEVDPWIGMMAEDPEPGKALGPTLTSLYTHTFTNLRKGDRFYYEIDPLLDEKDVLWVKNTRLSHVIKRNFNLANLPEDVFKPTPLEEWPHHQIPISSAVFDAIVYPNPFVQEFQVRIFYPHPTQGSIALRLLTLTGEVIWEQKSMISQGTHPYSTPPTSSLPKGIYWLQCYTDHYSKTLKIIKL
jgi:peroxidase